MDTSPVTGLFDDDKAFSLSHRVDEQEERLGKVKSHRETLTHQKDSLNGLSHRFLAHIRERFSGTLPGSCWSTCSSVSSKVA